jgi:hypothetical protein
LLKGPFVRVVVHYTSSNAQPSANRAYTFTITAHSTIAQLVAAVNRPTQVWMKGGSGGAVLSSQRAVLDFVRTDGGARVVVVQSITQQFQVGRTPPLRDTNGALMKLVARIVTARCPAPATCA